MHLFLVRHGESLINLPDYDRAGGWDVPLTERGERQAAAVALWMRDHLLKPDVIYSSTMKRAHQTANYIADAYGKALNLDDRIREIGNNHMDHKPVSADKNAHYGDYWASERPFSSITPNINYGETLMHFRARIGMFMEEITTKHREQIVVVVCHGFVIDSFLDIAYNVGPYRSMEVWSSNTGITHMQLIEHPGRERWRLYFMNRIEHLAGIGGLGITASGRPESWQN